jgi:hypothetical protein
VPRNIHKNSKKIIEQEGKILLAITALKNHEIRSIRQAAIQFDVPEATLRRRYNGVPFCKSIAQYRQTPRIRAVSSRDLSEATHLIRGLAQDRT